MAISGYLPKHLEVGARTAVLASKAKDDLPYQRVAQEVDLTAKTQTLVDLGGMPVPTESAKVVESMIEKTKDVEPKDWYLTLSISQNAIDDDQTSTLESQFKNLLPAFQRHINSKVFTVLNAGDGTTYGYCYDGQQFFDSDHADPGAKYTTDQDNEYDLALNLANFNTVYGAARKFKDDQGNYMNLMYDLLVCSTVLRYPAAQIAENAQASGTANREINPYEGQLGYITVPEFDDAAWVLVASKEPVKPLLVPIRKRPVLLNQWFDSQAGDGGIHYFQYHARYDVVYGDWRTAIMGNS